MATKSNMSSESMSSNGRAAAEEVRRQAQSGASAAHDTVERVAERAHEVVDRAKDAASRTADNLSSRSGQMGEMTDEWVETARSYMQQHPVATITMAVAAGFLLSKILSSDH